MCLNWRKCKESNQKLYSAYSTLGNLKFEGYVRDNYGSMINFKDIIKQNVTQELNIKGIEGILQEVGIYDEEIIESIKDTIYKNGEQFGIEMLSKTIINKKRNIFCEKEERKYWGPAIDDIISAIYKNQEVKIESGGNNIIRYRHETQYWNTTSDGLLSMCELMANYNQLKLSGNLEQISWLRDIFGDELFDLLENTYNRAFS